AMDDCLGRCALTDMKLREGVTNCFPAKDRVSGVSLEDGWCGPKANRVCENAAACLEGTLRNEQILGVANFDVVLGECQDEVVKNPKDPRCAKADSCPPFKPSAATDWCTAAQVVSVELMVEQGGRSHSHGPEPCAQVLGQSNLFNQLSPGPA